MLYLQVQMKGFIICTSWAAPYRRCLPEFPRRLHFISGTQGSLRLKRFSFNF